MTPFAKQDFKEITIEAVKITADGRRIPLGTIGYWSRNPLKRAWYWLRRKLGA